MSKEKQNTEEVIKGNHFIADVSGSDIIVENEQIALYFQFDDGKPIEAMKCNGKKFTMEILPGENNFITFTDGEKTFKLFVRHCH